MKELLIIKLKSQLRKTLETQRQGSMQKSYYRSVRKDNRIEKKTSKGNINTTYQNSWNAARAELGEKFIVLTNIYIKN